MDLRQVMPGHGLQFVRMNNISIPSPSRLDNSGYGNAAIDVTETTLNATQANPDTLFNGTELGAGIMANTTGLVQNKSSQPLDERLSENSAAFWQSQAQETLKAQLKRKTNKNIAKNVIIFLGDGMSV